MQLGLGELVLASALPVLEVVLMCLVGAALVWKGIMTVEGRTLLTKLTYFVFFPSLVVTSLGTSVTATTLQSWWPVPVSILLNVVLGMLLGAAVFPFIGMEAHLRPHFISCAGVGNLGNLLIVLVPSIASKSSIFSDEDGEKGLAYVFTGLFAIFGQCRSFAAFTVVGALLERRDAPQKPHGTDIADSPPSPPPTHASMGGMRIPSALETLSDSAQELSGTQTRPLTAPVPPTQGNQPVQHYSCTEPSPKTTMFSTLVSRFPSLDSMGSHTSARVTRSYNNPAHSTAQHACALVPRQSGVQNRVHSRLARDDTAGGKGMHAADTVADTRAPEPTVVIQMQSNPSFVPNPAMGSSPRSSELQSVSGLLALSPRGHAAGPVAEGANGDSRGNRESRMLRGRSQQSQHVRHSQCTPVHEQQSQSCGSQHDDRDRGSNSLAVDSLDSRVAHPAHSIQQQVDSDSAHSLLALPTLPMHHISTTMSGAETHDHHASTSCELSTGTDQGTSATTLAHSGSAALPVALCAEAFGSTILHEGSAAEAQPHVHGQSQSHQEGSFGSTSTPPFSAPGSEQASCSSGAHASNSTTAFTPLSLEPSANFTLPLLSDSLGAALPRLDVPSGTRGTSSMTSGQRDAGLSSVQRLSLKEICRVASPGLRTANMQRVGSTGAASSSAGICSSAGISSSAGFSQYSQGAESLPQNVYVPYANRTSSQDDSGISVVSAVSSGALGDDEQTASIQLRPASTLHYPTGSHNAACCPVQPPQQIPPLPSAQNMNILAAASDLPSERTVAATHTRTTVEMDASESRLQGAGESHDTLATICENDSAQASQQSRDSREERSKEAGASSNRSTHALETTPPYSTAAATVPGDRLAQQILGLGHSQQVCPQQVVHPLSDAVSMQPDSSLNHSTMHELDLMSASAHVRRQDGTHTHKVGRDRHIFAPGVRSEVDHIPQQMEHSGVSAGGQQQLHSSTIDASLQSAASASRGSGAELHAQQQQQQQRGTVQSSIRSQPTTSQMQSTGSDADSYAAARNKSSSPWVIWQAELPNNSVESSMHGSISSELFQSAPGGMEHMLGHVKDHMGDNSNAAYDVHADSEGSAASVTAKLLAPVSGGGSVRVYATGVPTTRAAQYSSSDVPVSQGGTAIRGSRLPVGTRSDSLSLLEPGASELLRGAGALSGQGARGTDTFTEVSGNIVSNSTAATDVLPSHSNPPLLGVSSSAKRETVIAAVNPTMLPDRPRFRANKAVDLGGSLGAGNLRSTLRHTVAKQRGKSRGRPFRRVGSDRSLQNEGVSSGVDPQWGSWAGLGGGGFVGLTGPAKGTSRSLSSSYAGNASGVTECRSSRRSSESDDTKSVGDAAILQRSGPGEHTKQKKTPRSWYSVLWRTIHGIFNVPTVAIAVGLGIACTPVLRRVFYGPDQDENEDSAVEDEKGQLDVVVSALTRLGGAAIPCMMIAIGGALSRGPGDSKVPVKAVLALLAIRLVILPAVGGWAVLAGQSAGLWADNGKMFTLVLALQQAMPTALNVHTMASVHENNEQVVAALLFWQYLACIITIPVCVLIFLSRITGSDPVE